jgi:hypothetical protein
MPRATILLWETAFELKNKELLRFPEKTEQ